RSCEKEKAKRELPSFDILTDMLKIQYKELNKKYGGCFDIDLLSNDDFECADEENDVELDMSEDTNVVNQKDDIESNVDLGVTRAAEDNLSDPKVVPNVDFGENVPDEGNQNRDFDDGMVPYHLRCTLDCGLPNEDLPMVLEFMLKNELLFAPVMQLRKEVMDYCFLNNHWIDKTEIVCNFVIYHNTTKKDIESLLPNTMIEAIVIESWAIMLNKMQMVGSGSTRPRRIFYGIAHSIVVEKMIDINQDDEDDGEMKKYRAEVFSTWDMWSGIYDEPLNLNAEMVFVHLLYEQHYFCVCIDFVREKLFYLDNRCYDDFNEMAFAYMTDVVANAYAEYLVSKGTENAEKVKEFMTINVPFDWQTREQDLDYGVFMMLHMMFFYGDIFDCELYNVQKRDLYRGEVAATLILSDFNGDRSEILERVTRHNEIKVSWTAVGGESQMGLDARSTVVWQMINEVVAVFGDGRSLTRGDILSLRLTVPVNIADVIHSLIEQEGKGDENKEQNLQKLFDTWDEFVSKNTVPCNWKAYLIFVSMVWEDHYLCVCINFTNEMVEVLDNTKYDQWEETIIYKAADL
ncbi:hypothetical protein KSS87_012912, partial [Heliosperma pusillum]